MTYTSMSDELYPDIRDAVRALCTEFPAEYHRKIVCDISGYVMLGLQNEREWQVFCERVLLQPELASDARFDSNPKRVERRAELRTIVLEVFAQLSAAQVIERLEQAHIANAHLNTLTPMPCSTSWATPPTRSLRCTPAARSERLTGLLHE